MSIECVPPERSDDLVANLGLEEVEQRQPTQCMEQYHHLDQIERALQGVSDWLKARVTDRNIRHWMTAA